MKLALSTLCENPLRPTGLTTLFQQLVAESLRLFDDLEWIVFCGRQSRWPIEDRRVTLVRDYPSNEAPRRRLWADHVCVGPRAKTLGAQALLTVGFMPIRAPLPVVMHVFSLHHLSRSQSLRDVYRKAALGRGFSKAALVIANSAWTAERLKSCGQTIHAPVLISPEGVEHARFRPEREEGLDDAAKAALSLPERYLFWSSNFYPYKRADRALAAYARLPTELRRAFPLVLSGGNWNGGLARAQEEARRLGIASDTRFLGWIEDRWLPACFRGAQAHILSTTEETFGRAVLDGMASGCPSVLQDLPVLREVAGDAALYVDFADADAGAAAITRLCTEPETREKLRLDGLRRAREFGFERLARERLEAIRRIV